MAFMRLTVGPKIYKRLRRNVLGTKEHKLHWQMPEAWHLRGLPDSKAVSYQVKQQLIVFFSLLC